jgi:hypothetical protein
MHGQRVVGRCVCDHPIVGSGRTRPDRPATENRPGISEPDIRIIVRKPVGDQQLDELRLEIFLPVMFVLALDILDRLFDS